MAKVWIELRYDYGSGEMPLAVIDSPTFLRATRFYLLRAQEALVRKARGLDLVLGFLEGVELERLRGVLDLLIPEDAEDTCILIRQDGDEQGQQG